MRPDYTTTSTSDPQGGGGGSSNPLNIHSTTGSATLSLEANTDVANAKTTIQLKAESATATEDRTYTLATDPGNSDHFVIQCDTNQQGQKEGWRFSPDGRVSFACGLQSITNHNSAGFQVRGSSWLRDTLRVSGAVTAEDGIILSDGKTITRPDGTDLLASSGGGSSDIVAVASNASETIPDDFTGKIIWAKNENFVQGGGQLTLNLPQSPSNGLSFEIQTLNGPENNGQIMLKLHPSASSHSFHSSAHNGVDNITMYSGDLLVQNVASNEYLVVYREANAVEHRWYVLEKRSHDPRVSQSLLDVPAVSNMNRTFFRYFKNDEDAYGITSNGLQLDDGYHRYDLVYGDGLLEAGDESQTYGIMFKLPTGSSTALADGTIVTMRTNHRYNSSNGGNVLYCKWSTDNGCPGTRKMIENGVETTATVGISRLESFAFPDQRRTSNFRYCASIDSWILTNDY